VSRKVSDGVGRIKLGLADALYLGNLDAQRDWGFAGDYVEAMWIMLQHQEPEDFVVSSGEEHSIRELVDIAFAHAGLDPDDHVRVDARFPRRPTSTISSATQRRRTRSSAGSRERRSGS
jgi:GDPmannose 4,6-dehydratase